ncbi:hypothetical protein [Mesorhizobium muleiense]|uniref:hypothetical protein n=1 Tax=Mesorhizobium muleiense TaxID=1004279 RepID=UPI001F21D038|nr:hypothetical protein [Mesorhizobium muleiense]MCF6112226.1 hypothetical protein [Mesorhizobium muleiense]
MHNENLNNGTVDRFLFCFWAILIAAFSLSALSAKAESFASPLTPSVKTKLIGDPSDLPVRTESFDQLLTDNIDRILREAGANRSSKDRLAFSGTIRATKLDVTLSGCLFPADTPPGDGKCPYPIAPIEYRGAGSIELMAALITKQILKIVQLKSTVKTLYLGCQPDRPADPTFSFGLTILADGIQRSTAQHIDVESSLFSLPCAQPAGSTMPQSSALLDFGAHIEGDTVVLKPSLAVAGQPGQKLPSLRFHVQADRDPFAMLRDYSDELTPFFTNAVVASLLPKEERSAATQLYDPEALRDPADAARIFRTAGYPKLAETFVAASAQLPGGTAVSLSVQLERGLLMLQRGDYETAFQHLRGTVGAQPFSDSPAIVVAANRALVDAAYLARHYSEAVKAGETALETPALNSPSATKDAIAIRVHLVNAYSLRALACLDPHAQCGGTTKDGTSGGRVETYNERVDRATDDLDAAVRHLVVVRNADSEKAAQMGNLANNLATAALNLVDPAALRRSDDAAWQTSERLFAELRAAAIYADQEIEERHTVLLGRVSIVASAVRAPAKDELLKAIELFEEARDIRNSRLETRGAYAHPLLDFEVAEAFAMRQEFTAALASAHEGQRYLDSDTVKKTYANSSWDILTALYESLATLSEGTQSADPATVFKDFRERFYATKGLPLIQPLPTAQEKMRSSPITWKFDPLYLYACEGFEGEVREATLAMLELVFERERAVKGTEPPKCSPTVQPH